MPKKQVQVEIEDSGYELQAALAKLVKASKEALKDGFQPGQDLPLIMVEAVRDFPAIVAQLPALKGDLQEDKVAFLKGLNLGAYDLVEAIVE